MQPWWKFQLIGIWEFMMIPLHTTTAHEICCGNKSNHLDSIFDCLIERLALGISHLFYNLFKSCWLLDGPRIKRPNMTSWTSKRRSFGTSFFRRSDCLKLTHLPFFEQCKTRELVDGCMHFKITAFGAFQMYRSTFEEEWMGGGGGKGRKSLSAVKATMKRKKNHPPPEKKNKHIKQKLIVKIRFYLFPARET